MKHECCYHQCPEEGTIHIGANGNPDTHWICFDHLSKRNADRDRFLADGGGCEMEELGEPLREGSIAMRRAKRLDRQNVPVRSDVFLHRLEPSTLEALRRALEQGLTPSGLDFGGDDNSIAILRFTRPRAGDAHLMVSVEFSAEENEVVGKVYDAEFRLKYASEPRDAHLAGTVRATVSRLLRELAAKVAGDPSF